MATASIWSMRSDGSAVRRTTQLVLERSDLPGSFSPDGRTLAFTRRTYTELGPEGRVRNTAQVWAARPDGSAQRLLAERSADPAFAPDGRRFAFVSDRDQNGELSYGDRVRYANELYMANEDGSNAKRLTNSRSLDEGGPSWLPGGRRIAYQRGKVTGNAMGTIVMEANADGTCAARLIGDTTLTTWYAAPAWRPRHAPPDNGRITC